MIGPSRGTAPVRKLSAVASAEPIEIVMARQIASGQRDHSSCASPEGMYRVDSMAMANLAIKLYEKIQNDSPGGQDTDKTVQWRRRPGTKSRTHAFSGVSPTSLCGRESAFYLSEESNDLKCSFCKKRLNLR
jgi:hypothetical protein